MRADAVSASIPDAPDRHLAPSAADRLVYVRLAAASVVVYAHSVQVFLYPVISHGHPFARMGGVLASLAVGVFFFVSGFLIAHSIMARSRTGIFEWRSFAFARIRRIVPPFLFAVALTALCVGIITYGGLYGADNYLLPGDFEAVRPRATISLREILWTLTLSYNLIPGHGELLTLNGPLWSLSYEVWLYAAAMCAAIAVVNRVWFAAGIAVSIVLVPSLLGNRMFAIFTVIWIWGFVSAILPRPSERTVRNIASAWLVMIGFAFAAAPAVRLWIVQPYGIFIANIIFVGNTIAICALVFAWVLAPSPSKGEMSDGRMPDFSYTLYVTHFPLMCLLLSLLRPLLDARSVIQMAALAVVSFTTVLVFAGLAGSVVENLWRGGDRLRSTATASPGHDGLRR